MSAAIGKFAFFNDQNLFGILDGRKPVCNDDKHLVVNESRKGLLDFSFVFGVGVSGCFVQNDDVCVFENCTCNRDALAFASGEPVACIACFCVVAVFKRADELVAAGGLCGFVDFFIACFRAAHADVFHDGNIEQVVVLCNIADFLHLLLERNL